MTEERSGQLHSDNNNSRSCFCIFILFNPLSSWCSPMTLKGPGTGNMFAQAGSLALSPRWTHHGNEGRRGKSGLGPSSLAQPSAWSPRYPARPLPGPLGGEKQTLRRPPLRTASRSCTRGGYRFTQLESPNGYATPAQRLRPRSLTAHPPNSPASPSSSDHSTLLCSRLF